MRKCGRSSLHVEEPEAKRKHIVGWGMGERTDVHGQGRGVGVGFRCSPLSDLHRHLMACGSLSPDVAGDRLCL